jgi:phage replication O-like protein O
MANPQKENGYTAIANEIMDALISKDLSGQELRVTLFVIRKTYGFQKTEDAISLTQIMKALNVIKVRASQIINKLQLMKILTVTQNINGIVKKYSLNKDFDTWETVNKNINRKCFDKRTVNKNINRPLMKSVTTKETITKENIQKKIYTSEFLQFYNAYPKHIGKEPAWKAWVKLNGERPPVEELVTKINQFKKTDGWKKDNGQYIPHPATWLNQKRWNDEIETHPPTPPTKVTSPFLDCPVCGDRIMKADLLEYGCVNCQTGKGRMINGI